MWGYAPALSALRFAFVEPGVQYDASVATSHDDYEFSATYSFSEEVPVDYNDLDNVDVIEGEVTLSADLEWDDSDQEYVYRSIYWEETSGRFDTNGEPPGGEERFLDDARAFLLSKDVDASDIGW